MTLNRTNDCFEWAKDLGLFREGSELKEAELESDQRKGIRCFGDNEFNVMLVRAFVVHVIEYHLSPKLRAKVLV